MRYVMFPHLTRIEEKTVKTYGVMCFNKFLCGKIVKDISTDRKSVRQFVRDLNDYQIELVHLDDVLEDFLCR